MVMEGMAMVPKFLHIYSTDGTKISLDVNVFFLMYIGKLVCSKSDSNQEAIREQ